MDESETGGENGLVATDTFVFLCDTNLKATMGRHCPRLAEMSHCWPTCPLAEFDYVRTKLFVVCSAKDNKSPPFDSVPATMCVFFFFRELGLNITPFQNACSAVLR